MKRISILVITVLFVLFFSGTVKVSAGKNAGLSPEGVFYRANICYETGDYDESIKMYKSLSEKGLRSGNLYYNLGNAYFEKGDIGRALLNYERARWMMPADADLLSNYRFVASKMKRPDPVADTFILLRWLEAGTRYFTLRGMFVFSVCLWFFLAGYTITTRVFGIYRGYSGLIIFVLVFFLVLSLIPLRDRMERGQRLGFVTEKIVDVRFEPFPGSEVNFPMYEGMSAMVLRESRGWYKIKSSEGRIGWIPSSALEKISIGSKGKGVKSPLAIRRRKA